MASLPLQTSRFLRKTTLAPTEYRKNFRQMDNDVIAMVTSPEADEVTPLMSKIYLRLINAPDAYWERQGVLRFEVEIREGKRLTAWAILCALLHVSSATANKALTWMHREGIIGYFAGKNGVGVRIFLNRAASSVGIRPAPDGKKILDFSAASSDKTRTSQNEAAFKETYGNIDNLEIEEESGAQKNCAENNQVHKFCPEQNSYRPQNSAHPTVAAKITPLPAPQPGAQSVDEVIKRLRIEMEPAMRNAAIQAASHEHEQIRQWFLNHALPKAVRVAQASAYDVLRGHGLLSDPRSRSSNGRVITDGRKVGKQVSAETTPRLLSDEKIIEVAEICVALLFTQNQTIDRSLSEMSVEAGGFLLPGDIPKVRARAKTLALIGEVGKTSRRENDGF